MNPPLTQAQATTQLSLLTSQTTPANFTFSSDELTQAIQTAWNDPFVCKVVWDSSTSFVSGTYSYAIPSTITSVKDIYYTRSSTDFPEVIGKELYEVIPPNIIFTVNAQKWLAATYTLYIKGLYKLTSSDSLTTTALVNYTIFRAAEILLDNLLLKKTFYFLKTDTTVADIVRAQQTIRGEVLVWKQALLREFQSG